MTTLAIINQKGGSAKTTTVVHLGAALASLGKRVLLVDMDPQGHLAETFNISARALDREMSQVLMRKTPLRDVIVTVRPNLDLAPSNIRLSYSEPDLLRSHRREDRLKSALATVQDDYDVVLIDCPPNLGLLTVNALSAARYVLIPMAADFYNMLGVGLFLETLDEMRAELNPDLQVLGLLPTRYDKRTANAAEILERTRADLAGVIPIYDVVIPETVRFREAAAKGQTIYEYAPDSPGAAAYTHVAEEVAAHV